MALFAHSAAESIGGGQKKGRFNEEAALRVLGEDA
jgi:hypothetical protein